MELAFELEQLYTKLLRKLEVTTKILDEETSYKKAFFGKDLVSTIMKLCSVDRKKAIEIAKTLKEEGYFVQLTGSVFADNFTVYRFKKHEAEVEKKIEKSLTRSPSFIGSLFKSKSSTSIAAGAYPMKKSVSMPAVQQTSIRGSQSGSMKVSASCQDINRLSQSAGAPLPVQRTKSVARMSDFKRQKSTTGLTLLTLNFNGFND